MGPPVDSEIIIIGFTGLLDRYIARRGASAGAVTTGDDLEPFLLASADIVAALAAPPVAVSKVLPASIMPPPR